MRTRKDIISDFYGASDEDRRLLRTRQGQLEYRVTMELIHRYVGKGSRILEIGAATGRYSIALAREGMDVTAVELLDSNLRILKENSDGLENIRAVQGDAVDLHFLPDDQFDVTLVFGPMYHLYEKDEIDKAIDEAIRVTRPGGVMLYAFLSVYGIMFSNYMYGRWQYGLKENFTDEYEVKHFREQLFTGYDIAEFEELFTNRDVEHITTAGVDAILEPIERRPDFLLSDEDMESFTEWYLHICEKRELLGYTDHLLYVCRKK